MLFKDVIGQSNIKAAFSKMVATNRLPHALLLLGGEGSGKLALAVALAQYVLCQKHTNEDACGECPSCSKVSKIIHPDLHFSFPTIGANVVSDAFLPQWREAILENPYLNANQWLQHIGAENKQGNINKQECVNIVKKISLKTFENTKKIFIIWLPEYLGKEGNRLLKLIEEPPAQTLFILVAEKQELILNTILSRCQIIKINGLSDEDIKNSLIQKENITAEVAEMASHLSGGNYNEALQLAQSKTNNHADFFLEWLRKCYKGNGIDLVDWTEQFAKMGREVQKQFIQYALHFLREFMVLKLTQTDYIRLQTKELATAKKMIPVIEFDQIDKIAHLLSESSYHIERNANPKVLFLDVSIQVNAILRRL